MRWLLAVLLLAATPALAERQPVASASVERSGDVWTADYELHAAAPVWVFAKSVFPRESKRSWRIGTVEVLTPGVELQRLGNYDALVAKAGNVPPRVRLRFMPFLKDIEAGYDSALAFGDGSVALYTSQFKLVPMPSQEAASEASADTETLPFPDRPTHIEMRDKAGDVLFMGERTDVAVVDDYDAYVLFGNARPEMGEAMTTIIDHGLPTWLRSFILEETPPVLARYRKELGPAPVGKPTLMVSWAGAENEGASFGGSVLPGTVVMTVSGKQVLQPGKAVGNYARWLVAHESAHFWLGQAVRYSSPAESWITEGGADLLAFRAIAAANRDYDLKARLTRARQECEPFLRNGGIASAYERPDDFRAYYACGVIIALAAERANGGNFAGFVRQLIDHNRDDGVITRAEWLEQLGNPEVAAAAEHLLDHAHPNPGDALDRFIAIAGIAEEFAPPPPSE